MTSSSDGKNDASEPTQVSPQTSPEPQAETPKVTRTPSGVKDQGYPILKRPPVERVPAAGAAARVTQPSETPAEQTVVLSASTASAPDPAAEAAAASEAAPLAPAAQEASVAAASAESTQLLPATPSGPVTTAAVDAVPVGAASADIVSASTAAVDTSTAESTSADLTSEESPLGKFGAGDSDRRWPRNLLWAGLTVLVLAGAYVGAQVYFADRIARDTTVAGIDIGGLSTADAVAKLDAELGGVAVAPLPVTAGESATTLDPAAAGLVFDAKATVEDLTEFTLAPSHLLSQISGGGPVEPVTVVDEAKLATAVEAMSVDLEVPATSGTVTFVDGAAAQTAAVDGSGVDVDESTTLITSTWLTAARPLVLPTSAVEPDITQAETDAAFAVAQKVVSAPVTVAVGGQSVEIPSEFLAAAATFSPVDGDLVLAFDGSLLTQDVIDRTTDLLSESADAKFVFVDGAPTIQPGAPGTTLDPEALAAAVTTAATGDDRTAAVELVESDPAQSTAALEALGVKEVVSEFATPLTNEPVRTQNLQLAAERVTGTLVLPGEEFDLTEVIGPITAANGYQAAHVISGGLIVDGVGGGLSQMSTTTYNAGFFAGMVDLEHRPHSYWFNRYPEGRESTLAVGSINMRWRNDSPYGVLLRSWIADNKLHVAAWSTKYYNVEDSTSARSGVVAPSVETRSGAGCVASGAGNSGFSVSVWRRVTVIETGEEVINETNSWRYKPQNAIVCE